MNQPGGFKCPSCAYPDADCKKTLDFCENGAKALAHEATKFRVTREFFAQHTVSELMEQSDYWLEMQGRLTEPMRRSEEHTSELQSLMRISYAVFCLKKKITNTQLLYTHL